jgi:chromosome segregation ATPase
MLESFSLEMLIIIVPLLGGIIAMYVSVRGMRTDTKKEIETNATWKTEISRDIKDNKESIRRVADRIEEIARRMEKADGELRSVIEWKIETNMRLQNIESKLNTAFSRTDERGTEISDLRRDFSRGLREIQEAINNSLGKSSH